MSRSYSHVGLKEEAAIWLEQNIKVKPVSCPNCGTLISESVGKVKYSEEEVFCGHAIELYEYYLKDGKRVKEIFQEIPWASGPVGFLCLLIDGKRMFEWTENEIQSFLCQGFYD